MTDWTAIQRAISEAGGGNINTRSRRQIGGGCINNTLMLGEGAHRVFVKLNHTRLADMFAAEFAGLQAIAATDSIRVPEPICTGTAGSQSYLVMDYIQLDSGKPGSAERFGEQLAAMHLADVGGRYGWQSDNTIGSTPQCNSWEADWLTFWQEHRLGFQLNLAAQNGAGNRVLTLGERVKQALPALLQGLSIRPSCVHGDLWSGNWGFDADGAPVIFDPAVYFGDRETDLAMTTLFGAPGTGFSDAYQATYPIEAGYALRRTLYNLYHILNHYNLFGTGYLAQAEHMMQQLLSEVDG